MKSSTQEALRDDSAILPWLVEHAGSIRSRCQEGRAGERHLKDCTARVRHQVFYLFFGEKVLTRQLSTDPMSRMNPRYKFGIWLGTTNNSAECFIGHADAVSRAREM